MGNKKKRKLTTFSSFKSSENIWLASCPSIISNTPVFNHDSYDIHPFQRDSPDYAATNFAFSVNRRGGKTLRELGGYAASGKQAYEDRRAPCGEEQG